MDFISEVLVGVIIVLFMIFMIHQEYLFGRMIKQNEKVMRTSSDRLQSLIRQNNTLLAHADERLDRANEMVLTLAHSADKLSVSTHDLKSFAIRLKEDFVSEKEELIKSREDFRDAYLKLLSKYELLDADYKSMLKHLADKPTISNNNYPDTQVQP